MRHPEDVDDGEEAGGQGDGIARQPAGIAGTVKTLVVMARVLRSAKGLKR